MLKESPHFVRTSLAAAMTLGLKPGRFYRDAKLGCINLLLEYESGCYANCAYCGLSRQRPGQFSSKSFIRVEWPGYPLSEIIERIQTTSRFIGRVCISMITHPRAVEDTVRITQELQETGVPVSLLISPTVLDRKDLETFKAAGADRIGIAIDAATPELFDLYRAKGVKGPHKWDTYWKCFSDAVAVFGKMYVGSHWIVGLGETEKEMVKAFRKTRRLGGFTHLFSFYPEHGSALNDRAPCPMGQYRRMQLARYLVDNGYVDDISFEYNDSDQLIDFQIPQETIDEIITSGKPFMTSGCPDKDGNVACNRPYANSLPGPDIRNFPFPPEPDDIKKIRKEIYIYS